MNTYVITGATGHTGRPIVIGLLEKGHTVRIISRSSEKAKDLVQRGAVLYEGDTTRADLLKQAFDGADAAYLMIPFDNGASDYLAMQLRHANAFHEALTDSHVRHVVTLSSMGAHLPEGIGIMQGLERMEQLLNRIPGTEILHLRAGYFMENIRAQVSTIRFIGSMAYPLRGDLPIPMIATCDVAAYALQRLLSLDFSGKSHHYLLGPRDVTYQEVARIIGAAIGRPDLKYHAVGYNEARNAMVMMGMGRSLAARIVEYAQGLNEGRIQAGIIRAPENCTPTSIEEFAPLFKKAFDK